MALIDKDQIRARIEREMGEITYGVGEPKDVYTFCGELIAFLDSIQEQPEVDLKKEVTKFVLSKEYIEGKEPPVLLTARHFAEWGRKQVLQEIYDGKVKPVDKITAAWLADEQNT